MGSKKRKNYLSKFNCCLYARMAFNAYRSGKYQLLKDLGATELVFAKFAAFVDFFDIGQDFTTDTQTIPLLSFVPELFQISLLMLEKRIVL